MTITLELPKGIEDQIAAQASARGISIDAYVQEWLAASTPPAAPAPRLSAEAVNKLLDELAGMIPAGIVLSDEAMSRESIYAREDEW